MSALTICIIVLLISSVVNMILGIALAGRTDDSRQWRQAYDKARSDMQKERDKFESLILHLDALVQMSDLSEGSKGPLDGLF